MLLEAAARTRGLLRQPEPFVLQKALGEFGVLYEINAYTDNPHAMMRLYSALHSNILDLFNEYGVQIMVPAYEGDPEQPKVVPRGQWFPAPVPNSGTFGQRRQFGRELWSGGQELAGTGAATWWRFAHFR